MKRTRYFQWIDGELSGKVEILTNITSVDGEYFYNFLDGESCNLRYISKMTSTPAALKGKVMVEIASPQDPWVATTITATTYKNAGSDEIVVVPPLEDITSTTTNGNGQNLDIGKSVLGTKQFKAPKYAGPFSDLPSLDDYFIDDTVDAQPSATKQAVPALKVETPLPASAPVQEQPTSQASTSTTVFQHSISKDDPIEILAKTCKKHPTDINLTITMDLPSKAIYKMVSDEFEEGGIGFINCLISNLDVNDVIDSIRTALILAYSKNEE